MRHLDARLFGGIFFTEGGVSLIFAIIAYFWKEAFMHALRVLSTDISSFLGVVGFVLVVVGLVFGGYSRKCMPAKLDTTTEQESTPKPSAKKPVETAETNKTGPQNCAHYLGYLKERGKNTPIPNQCLTCPETIKCMLS